jgi:hypothetical protein
MLSAGVPGHHLTALVGLPGAFLNGLVILGQALD